MSKVLSIWTKLLYSFGTLGFSLLDRIMITWLMFFWVNEESGNPLLKPTVFGIIMVLGRIVDAIADPLVAQWSDRSKNPSGRRIPFMFWGGFLYVIVFVALFYPLAQGASIINTIYLAILLGGYFFLFTFYVTPYLALLPELARTNEDRVDLSTLKAVFTLVGTALAMIGSGILIDRFGFHGMVWAFAILGLITLYLPVLIKERDFCNAEPSTLGLIEAVLTTLKNKAFLIYMVGNITFWFGFNIVTLTVPFYVTVLMKQNEIATTGLLGATFGVAILVFPLVNLLSKRWGLKAMMGISMGLYALLLPFIYFIPNPFLGLNPYNFGMILFGLMGIPLAGLFIVPDAIVAVVTDYEEKLTGERREAMYFGTQGLILKISLGLSTLFTGVLMDLFGQTITQPLGIQLTGPTSAVFIIIGLLIFLKYPENKKQNYHEGQIVSDSITG